MTGETPLGSYREAPPRPPPARPPIKLAFAIALGCFALAIFTSSKLWTMAKLRGDVDGIPEQEMSVGRELSRFGSGAVVYQLIDERGGEWKIQAGEAQAKSYRSYEGAKVRVRCLERSHDCYQRGSVYIDDGNRQFDFMLLAIEISGLLASLVVVQRRRAAWRRTKHLTAPPRA
jgi:hypothetical protein